MDIEQAKDHFPFLHRDHLTEKEIESLQLFFAGLNGPELIEMLESYAKWREERLDAEWTLDAFFLAIREEDTALADKLQKLRNDVDTDPVSEIDWPKLEQAIFFVCQASSGATAVDVSVVVKVQQALEILKAAFSNDAFVDELKEVHIAAETLRQHVQQGKSVEPAVGATKTDALSAANPASTLQRTSLKGGEASSLPETSIAVLNRALSFQPFQDVLGAFTVLDRVGHADSPGSSIEDRMQPFLGTLRLLASVQERRATVGTHAEMADSSPNVWFQQLHSAAFESAFEPVGPALLAELA